MLGAVAAENGLGLVLTAQPAAVAMHFAARADRAGFRSALFPETTFADSFEPATAAAPLRPGLARAALPEAGDGDARHAHDPARAASRRRRDLRGRGLLGAQLPVADGAPGAAAAHLRRGERAEDDSARRGARRRNARLLPLGRVRTRRRDAESPHRRGARRTPCRRR